jgi:hypothetical protein
VTYNNIPNISRANKNNKIKFIPPTKDTIKIIIPTGSYGLSGIDAFIQQNCPDSGWRTMLNKRDLKLKLYCEWDIDFFEETL